MIDARAALTRQVQEFFHQHLVGVFSWEQIDHEPPQPIEKPNGGWPKDKERPDGKFHERLRMSFGNYDLVVESPTEQPPCGWIKLIRGFEEIAGPLDAATWREFGNFIRKQEHHHGSASAR